MKKKLCQSCAKRVISFPEALEGIQYLRGQDEWGEGGQKLSIFVHTQGIKTILAGVGWGGGGGQWQNYVHIYVDAPLPNKVHSFCTIFK